MEIPEIVPIINEKVRAKKLARIALGLCCVCGKNLLVTKTMCRVCADASCVAAKKTSAKRRSKFISLHGVDGRSIRKLIAPVEIEKRCRVCQSAKVVEEFGWSDGEHTRRKTICKECDVKRAHAWGKAHPESRSKSYWRRHLKRKFGITEAEFETTLAAQGGGCAICGKAQRDARKQRLCVDHSHVTGRLRGILCFGCNIAIGMLEDSPTLLEKAVAYLREHGHS